MGNNNNNNNSFPSSSSSSSSSLSSSSAPPFSLFGGPDFLNPNLGRNVNNWLGINGTRLNMPPIHNNMPPIHNNMAPIHNNMPPIHNNMPPIHNNIPSPPKRVFVNNSLVLMAIDWHGCHCLQAKIDEGNPRNVEAILSVVKDNIHELIKHPFANYLIQKIFKARNTVTLQQIHSLVLSLISDHQKLIDVCKDNCGTRVMQNMLENINHPLTIYRILCAVEYITVALMKNLNGSYVLQQCLKLFEPKYKKMLLDKVAQNCVEVATDKAGCTAIQRCLGHVGGVLIELLIKRIVCNAMVLAVDPYGNYVLQCVIKMGVKKKVIEVLHGNFVRLSMDKHASNVVEDLLRYSEENDVAVIVEEIMTSRAFLTVVQDPFGNYVAQRALECTKGGLRCELAFLIKSYRRKLQNHLFGKRVLAEAVKILKEGNWFNV